MATTFIALVAVSMIVQMKLDVQQAYSTAFDYERSTRDRRIGLVLNYAETIFRKGDQDLLIEKMALSVEEGLVDFVFLSENGQVQKTALREILPERDFVALARDYPPNQLLVMRPSVELGDQGSEEIRFVERKLNESWSIKAGHLSNRQKFIDRHAELFASENQRMTLFGILISLGVFFYAARDILKLTRQIGRKGLSGLTDGQASTFEGEKLRQGLLGLKNQSERLEKKVIQFERQILPALKTELSSGQEPPYAFECAMVRTDINEFTKHFNSIHHEKFVETVRLFFDECAIVISRYEGLIYEFVGDEVIYYFKADRVVDPVTRAIHCVAEINKLAELIDERYRDQFRFTVKSSLSYGQLRFGRLLNGFALSGAPLIETTRVLSNVSERDGCRLYFDEKLVARLPKRVCTEFAFSVQLKGFEHLTRVFQVDFKRTETTIEGVDIAVWRDLVLTDRSHFRDLKSVEIALQSTLSLQTLRKESVELIRTVETKHETRSNRVADLWLQAMQYLYQQLSRSQALAPNEISEDLAWYTYGVLAQAYPSLVPVSDRTQQHKGALIDSYRLEVPRLKANSIGALGVAFATDPEVALIINEMKASDQKSYHRARSLALITSAGQEGLTAETVSQLKSMVLSNRPLEVSAGLFALGEIVQMYLDQDPAHLRTQFEVIDLVQSLDRLTRSRDHMIQTQATVAMQKSRHLREQMRRVA